MSHAEYVSKPNSNSFAGGHTAIGAVRYAHEAERLWLAFAEVGAFVYRHTHGVGIEGAGEQRVTEMATVSETRKGFAQPNIFCI